MTVKAACVQHKEAAAGMHGRAVSKKVDIYNKNMVLYVFCFFVFL